MGVRASTTAPKYHRSTDHRVPKLVSKTPHTIEQRALKTISEGVSHRTQRHQAAST